MYTQLLMALRHLVRRLAGLPPRHAWSNPAREGMLTIGIDYLEANRLSGAYAEFGVWRGETLATACRLAQVRQSFRFGGHYAFDSFEGFPELSGADVHPMFKTGDRACSLEQMSANLERFGVPPGQVKSYKGWFSVSLVPGGAADREIADGSLSFVWADCDLYESTRDLLPFLFRKAKPGAVVAFDDWFCFDANPEKGVQKAVFEYLAAHPEVTLVPFHRFGWHGYGFIFQKLTGDAIDMLGQVRTGLLMG